MSGLDPQRHTKPLQFFLATNGQEIKWILLNCLLYGCAAVSLTVGSYVLGKTIDVLQNSAHQSLTPFLAIIVASFFCYEFGYRLGHILEISIIARLRNRMKKALLQHTTSLSFGYFADRFAGEIAHKVSSISNAMERLTLLITNQVVEQSFIGLGGAAALAFASPYLALYVIVWALLFVLGIIPYARRMNVRAIEYARAEAQTAGAFVDMYSNMSTVKVYGSKGKNDSVAERIDTETRAYRALGLWSILTHNFMGLSMAVLGTGLLLITSYLYAHALLTLGDVVFVSTIGLRLIVNVWEVGKAVPEFIRQRGEAAQNLEDIVVAPSILDGHRVESEQRRDIDIEYRDVTFAYGGTEPVLKNFSLSIRAGEKIGIVGLSGAGKTTFANLLLRFFDVQSGAIHLGDTDIREYSQEYLRSHISYISQDTALFHASVAENIAYGATMSSRAKIERAAVLACANEFIEKLPVGYEAIVGERGVKLSGGQRQRIVIARAILADRPVFLLDEATSALDSNSESNIQKGLAHLMHGKTVIAIAHRLSTLSHMDRIIFLEHGRIVEEGTHDELLTKNGKYAQLWHMQAGGFLPDDL